MFRGQFVHSVDAKGRISLPARFRDVLLADKDARFVLTPALFDPCLHLYPMAAWQEFEQKVAGLPSLDPNAVRFRRMYVSAAVECELDKAGRVADFIELGELMCIDALQRRESCGGHFREEMQTEDGEAKRDDENFCFVSAWEFKGENSWELHKENLEFEVAHPSQRSYK